MVFGLPDLINKNFISTASVVFRNNMQDLPKAFYKLKAGDWGLYILHAQKGKIYYIKDCMSAYRKHENGIWTKLSYKEMIFQGIKVMKQLDKMLDYEYHEEFKIAIAKRRSLYKSEPLIKTIRRKLRIRSRIKQLLKTRL